LRSVIDLSNTALGDLQAGKLTDTVRRRLGQMANKLATACESLVTAVREVLDDRFWKENP
jgi:hypothetical protein